MLVHSFVFVQGIRSAIAVMEVSVPPIRLGERTPVWKPRMAVIAGRDPIDVDVVGPARDRGESGGQSNDDREKGLFHDSLDLSEERSQQVMITSESRIS